MFKISVGGNYLFRTPAKTYVYTMHTKLSVTTILGQNADRRPFTFCSMRIRSGQFSLGLSDYVRQDEIKDEFNNISGMGSQVTHTLNTGLGNNGL